MEEMEKTKKEGIIRLMSLIGDGANGEITIPELDGRVLRVKAEKTFKFFGIDFAKISVNKPCLATPETSIEVYQAAQNCNLMEVFEAIPGEWNQKWISKCQVVNFCEKNAYHLAPGGAMTLFLCKIDEEKAIDEENPSKNLVIVFVRYITGLFISAHPLNLKKEILGSSTHRFIVPKERNEKIKSLAFL